MIDCSPHAAHKYLPPPSIPRRLALCFAGSGFRALLFHVGALRRWNELGLLSRAGALTAAGAGSLVVGALASKWKSLHPDANGVLQGLNSLVETPLLRLAQQPVRLPSRFSARLRPSHWKKLWRGDFSRADLFADYLDASLSLGRTLLAEAPEEPRFQIHATHLATGERWEFSRQRIGSEALGFASADRLRWAEAAAASALPLETPSMLLRFGKEGLESGKWGPAANALRSLVALTDGSLADPLAVNAVWRSHRQLLVADGGQRLLPERMTDHRSHRQRRALALVRFTAWQEAKHRLVGSLVARRHEGAYMSLSAYHGHYGLAGSVGFPPEVVDRLECLPTGYRPFRSDEARILVNHGYTIAATAVSRYFPSAAAVHAPLALPFPQMVDRAHVLTALGAEQSGPKGRQRAA